MASIAVVAEGTTDQVLIEHALYAGEFEDELVVNYIQPPDDVTDRSAPEAFGGWEQVLKFCASERFKQALQFNDFILIHLDTDITEHVNVGIPHNVDGVERSVDELVQAATEFLVAKIGQQFYENNSAKILFAIAVHSIECWLLPHYARIKADANRTRNCEERLVYVVNRYHGLKCEKTPRCYQDLGKVLRTRKILRRCRECNESLSIFLDLLVQHGVHK